MKTILVIEDQPQMRRNVCTVLEMEGFEVLTADNGRLGVAAAKEDLPDLILCDIMMPELDGYGVLQSLRSHKPTATTPFIFLTARGEKPDIRAGMAMLLAAMCAEGESTINNVGQIERGYERIDERLRALGAKIERVEERRTT